MYYSAHVDSDCSALFHKHADKVALMKGGRIVEHGTYKELLDRGVDFHAELGDGGQQTPQLSPAPSLTPANSMPGAQPHHCTLTWRHAEPLAKSRRLQPVIAR